MAEMTTMKPPLVLHFSSHKHTISSELEVKREKKKKRDGSRV